MPRLTLVGDGPEAFPVPEHLEPETREWFASVLRDYQLEPHHVHVLTLAAEALDRAAAARRALDENGLVFTDRFGQERPRPELAIARDSAILFARLLRELDLDVAPPVPPPRPPGLRSNRR